MTISKELEALKAHRKELDKRIRELEQLGYNHGSAYISVERFPTSIPDRWKLSIRVNNKYGNSSKELHRTIVSAKSLNDIVNSIPAIIDDLQNLYAKVKDDINGQESETA